jgi:hypothetical protein
MRRHGLQHVNRACLKFAMAVDVHQRPPAERFELPLSEALPGQAQSTGEGIGEVDHGGRQVVCLDRRPRPIA